MKKFKVDIDYCVVIPSDESQTIEIEAENADEAEDLAVEQLFEKEKEDDIEITHIAVSEKFD